MTESEFALQPPTSRWPRPFKHLLRRSPAAGGVGRDADIMFAGLRQLTRDEDARTSATHPACLARREAHVRSLAGYMRIYHEQPDAIARVFVGRDWSDTGAHGVGVLYGVACAAALAAHARLEKGYMNMSRVNACLPAEVRPDLRFMQQCAKDIGVGHMLPARYVALQASLMGCWCDVTRYPETSDDVRAVYAASGTMAGLAAYFPQRALSRMEKLRRVGRTMCRVAGQPRSFSRTQTQEANRMPRDLTAMLKLEPHVLVAAWRRVEVWAATLDDDALKALLKTFDGAGNGRDWVPLGGVPGAIYAGAISRWTKPRAAVRPPCASAVTPEEVYQCFARLVPGDFRLPLDTVHAVLASCLRAGASTELTRKRVHAALADLEAGHWRSLWRLGLNDFNYLGHR